MNDEEKKTVEAIEKLREKCPENQSYEFAVESYQIPIPIPAITTNYTSNIQTLLNDIRSLNEKAKKQKIQSKNIVVHRIKDKEKRREEMI